MLQFDILIYIWLHLSENKKEVQKILDKEFYGRKEIQVLHFVLEVANDFFTVHLEASFSTGKNQGTDCVKNINPN